MNEADYWVTKHRRALERISAMLDGSPEWADADLEALLEQVSSALEETREFLASRLIESADARERSELTESFAAALRRLLELEKRRERSI